MLIPGLVSVTFRSLAPAEIIHLACEAGLQTIEWGGDVHVPAGDCARARETGQRTREAGLMVSGYGSYYRLGANGADTPAFERVLASAVALGAPTIRVWAGTKGSSACSVDERNQVVADALAVAEMAARHGITISLEYHEGTLTDTPTSVSALLNELNHPNIEFFWQPSNGESVADCTHRLREVLPRLRNVHVFHWWPTARDRHPLSEGEARWETYVDILRQTSKTIDLLLEFVAEDSPEQLVADAATLRALIKCK